MAQGLDATRTWRCCAATSWPNRRRTRRDVTGLRLGLLLLMPPIAHALAQQPAATPLLSPVRAACISSPFGPRVLTGRPKAGTYHNGIDLPAAAGEAVRAVAVGRVARIQRKGAGGL